ncbi:DUF262 domain-containing protein [Aeromicrobium sp. JJY06]|uniref:GmrSD restriction endonuclease domain-containing protein n=1 Tax=Aeromicrobium sp. JJY06 TaxID=3373478 RepID=UPI00376F2A44
MSEPLPLRKVIEKINDGAIRIPGFQRKFVWEPIRAALLMDSIYKGYPFGSVLLWRTRTELKTEKMVGGFELPDPEKDYPIDYVLDGQQRLTSIFATFQTSLPAPAEDPESWLPIYYDFSAQEDAQDSRFLALQEAEVDTDKHFPLRTFFDPVTFSRAVANLPEARNVEIVSVQEKFKEALIPAETFETEDRTRVAIVFERVNRMGVELDMFELLTAWTWSEEFDLQNRFADLAEEFADFGFGEVGADNDLMLRCCAAILKGDPAPSAMIDINGSEVRQDFDKVEEALRLAIDFLRTNLQVRHLKFLPYSAQLIPLATYFSIDQSKSTPASDVEVLLRWFWRSTFAHRYSGNPGRNIKHDVEQAAALRSGKQSTLDQISATVGPDFFLDNSFSARTVASKALILMLAGNSPRSFLSGSPVNLDIVLSEPNRKEFHHCMPKAWLKKNHESIPETRQNSLANFAIISRSENREIGGKAPSEYRAKMPSSIAAIESSAFLPDSLWSDDPKAFFPDRASLLASRAEELIA